MTKFIKNHPSVGIIKKEDEYTINFDNYSDTSFIITYSKKEMMNLFRLIKEKLENPIKKEISD